MEGEGKSGEIISSTLLSDPKDDISLNSNVLSEKRRSTLRPNSSLETIPDESLDASALSERRRSTLRSNSSPETIPEASQLKQGENAAPIGAGGRRRSTVLNPTIDPSHTTPSSPTASSSYRKPSLTLLSADFKAVSSSRRPSLWTLKENPDPAVISSPKPSSSSSQADPLLDPFRRQSLSSPAPPPPLDVSKKVEEITLAPIAILVRPSITSRLLSLVPKPRFPFASYRRRPAQLPSPENNASDKALLEPTLDEKGMAEFLQRRASAAAQHRHKVSGDPASPANQAAVKRRTQVLSTVGKARNRLAQLSIQTVRRKREIAKGCFGAIRRWIFEREQRRLRGKGPQYLKLWNESLKKMESDYGSSIMLAFSFIRWVFLLNSVLGAVWLALMILPFMIKPPKSFKWSDFFGTLKSKDGIKNILQGQSLERTFVYYGGYTYTFQEQNGLWRVDFMYPLLIGASFLISFLGILGRIARRAMNSGGISMAAHLFPFSSLVFASWDFHLTSLEAAAKLRRSVRMQLKEMYADAVSKREDTGASKQFMSAKRFIALCLLWPLTMVGVVFAVDMLSTQSWAINTALGSEYAQAILFGVLNNITPVIARVLVEMEAFKPAIAERVVLTKLFFLRFLNLATFFTSSIRLIINTRKVRFSTGHEGTCSASACTEGMHCCSKPDPEWDLCDALDIQMRLCKPGCSENFVGSQVLRLIIITCISRTVFEFAYGYGYLWLFHGNKRQLLIEDMAMDVVYVQALVWWGICFSPVAPIVGFLSHLWTFYTMRWALFKTCAPVERAFSASRTSILTYGLLLVTLLLSTIPVSILIMEKKDGFCGPIDTQTSMYNVLNDYIQKAPSSLWLAFTWLLNPAVLLGVIFFLIFVVVLVQSQLIQTRQFLALTKFEMGAQRKESNEKLKRMRQNVSRSFFNSSTGSLTSLELSEALSELNLFRKTTLSLSSEVQSGEPTPMTFDKQELFTLEAEIPLHHANEGNLSVEAISSPIEDSLKNPSLPSTNKTDSQQIPVESQEKFIAEDQNEEGQDWLSLGKILRRLSQTQQKQMEVTKHVIVQEKESSLEDWHTLGHVLRRLSGTNVGMEKVSTKEYKEVVKVKEVFINHEDDDSPTTRTPIFATKTPCPNEDIGASSSEMAPFEGLTPSPSQDSLPPVSQVNQVLQTLSSYSSALDTPFPGESPQASQISQPPKPPIQGSIAVSSVEKVTNLPQSGHPDGFTRMALEEQPILEPLLELGPQDKFSIIDSFLPRVIRSSIKNRLHKRVPKKLQSPETTPTRGRPRKRTSRKEHKKSKGSTPSPNGKRINKGTNSTIKGKNKRMKHTQERHFHGLSDPPSENSAGFPTSHP